MAKKPEVFYCDVCGVPLLIKRKYCQSHSYVMAEYKRMFRFLDSEQYKKLPEIKYKYPVLKKVLAN
jgi:hypothetical protein